MDSSEPIIASEEPPRERQEPLKRIGCTALTVLALLILVASLFYFLWGLLAMFLRFFETVS